MARPSVERRARRARLAEHLEGVGGITATLGALYPPLYNTTSSGWLIGAVALFIGAGFIGASLVVRKL